MLLSAKSPLGRAALENQIAATDRQIDRLVYELYGLTEAEIRRVEEATGDKEDRTGSPLICSPEGAADSSPGWSAAEPWVRAHPTIHKPQRGDTVRSVTPLGLVRGCDSPRAHALGYYRPPLWGLIRPAGVCAVRADGGGDPDRRGGDGLTPGRPAGQ